MPAPSPQPQVLLLEDRVEAPPVWWLDSGDLPVVELPDRPAPPVPMFRAPGLAVLAAAGVLEGYRWIGLLAGAGSRPWAVVFAAVAVVGSVVLTRAQDGRARPTVQRLAVAAAAAVGLATAMVLWNDTGWASTALGTADLLLASTAMLALAAGERARRRDDVTP